ncbi:GNAT family N-acetyltransferase [Niveispirillum sp. KHB5.9]|uniref:GNAT family N-acetyltransferase n=1 Tax=Niveispirillum sp. KHB5.9 TaxID=3400269 RepID=UPI003A83A9F9
MPSPAGMKGNEGARARPPVPVLRLPGLRVRPERDADLAFLRRLYRSTRSTELTAAGWDEAMCRWFCDQQFDARRQDWNRRYPDAARLLLLRGTDPVGRLHLDLDGPDWRIIDIAFLPAACGHGTGSALLGDLIAQAGMASKGLALSVDPLNGRALALYTRLGFVETGRDASRLHLRHPCISSPEKPE